MNLKHELGVRPCYKVMGMITCNMHSISIRTLRLKFIASTILSEMKNFIRDHYE